MPKKTSRSARTLQAQRNSLTGGERKNLARPLLDLENSRFLPETGTMSGSPINGTSVADEPVATATETLPRERGIYQAPTENVAPISPNRPLVGSGTIRPASSRRPYTRRTTVNPNRMASLSREEEYSYIRSDLLTVFLLTVLLLIVLIVLTFFLGR